MLLILSVILFVCRKGLAVHVYDSDDERTYSKDNQPDPQADDFYHDEVDDFHAKKDKVSCANS